MNRRPLRDQPSYERTLALELRQGGIDKARLRELIALVSRAQREAVRSVEPTPRLRVVPALRPTVS